MSEAFPGQLGGFRPGELLAGYRLEVQIGAGGMAVVFRARDERLGRPVALKIMMPALAADSAYRRRFIAESRAAALVDDPHIIPIYEASEAEGVLFIAMRFVQGGDLRRVIEREGALAPARTAEFISPVASALDAAHAAGLVHRDVKPANILVDARAGRPDHVYLSDFGVVKGASASVSLTGADYLGTPHYSAPEQIDGLAVDGRTDQYALACVTYQLLTGAVPFERDHSTAVLLAHLSAPPPSLVARRPDLPGAVDQVIAKAMAKPPGNRYESCGDFADALREALGLTPYHARGSGTGPVQPAPSVLPPSDTPPVAAGATQTAPPRPSSGPVPSQTAAAVPSVPPPVRTQTAAATPSAVVSAATVDSTPAEVRVPAPDRRGGEADDDPAVLAAAEADSQPVADLGTSGPGGGPDESGSQREASVAISEAPELAADAIAVADVPVVAADAPDAVADVPVVARRMRWRVLRWWRRTRRMRWRMFRWWRRTRRTRWRVLRRSWGRLRWYQRRLGCCRGPVRSRILAVRGHPGPGAVGAAPCVTLLCRLRSGPQRPSRLPRRLPRSTRGPKKYLLPRPSTPPVRPTRMLGSKRRPTSRRGPRRSRSPGPTVAPVRPMATRGSCRRRPRPWWARTCPRRQPSQRASQPPTWKLALGQSGRRRKLRSR